MDPEKKPLIHNLDEQNSMNSKSPSVVVMIVAAIGLGIITGFILSKTHKAAGGGALPNAPVGTKVQTANSEDVIDEKNFQDKVEGDLKEGGKNGEGSFHLERPGGESQYVYLTSSTVDLSKYVGKKVRVRGQTQQCAAAHGIVRHEYCHTALV